MPTLDEIKLQIENLYKTNPKIHMDLNLSFPRLTLENEKATITGVYNHIFQIEEIRQGEPKRHTIQYTDLITRQIVIKELEKN